MIALRRNVVSTCPFFWFFLFLFKKKKKKGKARQPWGFATTTTPVMRVRFIFRLKTDRFAETCNKNEENSNISTSTRWRTFPFTCDEERSSSSFNQIQMDDVLASCCCCCSLGEEEAERLSGSCRNSIPFGCCCFLRFCGNKWNFHVMAFDTILALISLGSFHFFLFLQLIIMI